MTGSRNFTSGVSRQRVPAGLFAVLVFAAAAALAPSRSHAEPAYELKLKTAVGLRFKFRSESDMRMSLETAANGEVENRRERRVKRVRSGIEEVLEVREGIPTAKRIDFGADCADLIEVKGREPATTPAPFAGKSVTIRRVGEQRIDNDYKGALSTSQKREIDDSLDAEAVYLPAEPVAIDAAWEISKGLSRQLGLGAGEAIAAHCKLVSVKQISGTEVAELAVSGAFVRSEGFIEIATEVQGTVLVDTKTGRSIKTDLRGKMTASGTGKSAGADGAPTEVRVTGSGTMEIHENAEKVEAPSK